MRNRKTQGFTLIELLIVIAIIGILAAVLIPNLLNARARAFDTAAQTCLKELGVQQEVVASNSPFRYDGTGWTYGAAGTGGVTIPTGVVNACANVEVTATIAADGSTYQFDGEHIRGTTTYRVANGTGITVP